jgi:hypothetical protein
MPILLPVLDDRNYEQILQEALRRIPVYTPEWTNFSIESDPGVTLVQLFAFMTENLLYRANRVPEANRLKFLQLLNVPLLPANPADGLVTIQNERGPVEPLLLEQGVVVAAGNVQFVTRDPLNVLPVQAQVYYKQSIQTTDAAYIKYKEKYEALLAAKLAEQADLEGQPFPTGTEFEALGITPQFYDPMLLEPPKRGEALPEFDITQVVGRSLYIALLAPKNVAVDTARRAIANQVLSIGIAPTVNGSLPPLLPLGKSSDQAQGPGLVYEIADLSASAAAPVARYARLKVVQQANVFNAPGVVMVELPSVDQLGAWEFSEPLDEGTGDFPPRLEDVDLAAQVVTWLRIRLPQPDEDQSSQELDRRIAWIGINAARSVQVVPISNEYLGLGTGEPDQSFALANVPVIPSSVVMAVEDSGTNTPTWQRWRLVDDLLSAGPDEKVFILDAESGMARFGDGLRGQCPRGRILVSYEFGGGPQGNLSIQSINASPDSRLQGGYVISNPIPMSGGSLGETPADGERRIPLVVRHRDRLVTMQDFRDITRRAPGVNVGRVEVIPLFLPSSPDTRAAGVVTVMVIPSIDPLDPLWPNPDRLFLSRVCDHLDSRRLVTTEIYVRGPIYQPVYVSAGVQVKPGYFVAQVEKNSEITLRQFLSALRPGGPDGEGWPLKRRLIRKEIEAVLARVPGVEFVNGIEMSVKDFNDVEEFKIGGLELPRMAGVSVRQGSVEPLSSVFAPTGSAPSTSQGVPIPISKATC